MTTLIVKVILAYLLGSVSGSLLLGKLRKVDIRGLAVVTPVAPMHFVPRVGYLPSAL